MLPDLINKIVHIGMKKVSKVSFEIFYCWACDIEPIGGEGILARLFVEQVLKEFPDKKLFVVSPHRILIAKNSRIKTMLRGGGYSLEKHQDRRQTIFTKYATPFLGIIFLYYQKWKHSNCRTAYINYLPLWNFLLFAFLPKDCLLGPVVGGKNIYIPGAGIIQNFFRVYVFPFACKLSEKLICCRGSPIILGNPLSSVCMGEDCKRLIVYDTFNAIVMSRMFTVAQNEPLIKIYDFVFYFRYHPTKFPNITLNIIRELVRLNKRVCVIGDLSGIAGVQDLGYLMPSDVYSVFSKAACYIQVAQNDYSLTLFDAIANNLPVILCLVDGEMDKYGVDISVRVTVQPLPCNLAEKPLPSPSHEGNTESPFWGGELRAGELLGVEDYFKESIARVYFKKDYSILARELVEKVKDIHNPSTHKIKLYANEVEKCVRFYIGWRENCENIN